MMLRWLVTQFAQEAIRKQLGRASEPTAADVEGSAEPAAPEPPLPDPDVLLLFATPVEAQGTVDQMSRHAVTRERACQEHRGMLETRSIVVGDSGIGVQAARQATEQLLDRHPVSWVVSTGFAGGLRPNLARGNFLMPHEIVDSTQRCFSVGLRLDEATLQSTPGLHSGRLLTVDHLVRSTEERRRLGETYDSVACDMESIAVAEVCRARGIRFLSVRIISDGLDDALPPDVERLIKQQSTAAKLGAATGAIFRRPAAVKDLWKLHEDAARTSRRLSSFLKGIVQQLD